MLRDIGFWNRKGEYIEDYQEVGDEEMALSINDINNLQAENDQLKRCIATMTQPNKDKTVIYCQTCICNACQITKMYYTALMKVKEVCENQDLYRGRQALASRLLRFINEVEQEIKDETKMR